MLDSHQLNLLTFLSRPFVSKNYVGKIDSGPTLRIVRFCFQAFNCQFNLIILNSNNPFFQEFWWVTTFWSLVPVLKYSLAFPLFLDQLTHQLDIILHILIVSSSFLDQPSWVPPSAHFVILFVSIGILPIWILLCCCDDCVGSS